MKRKPLKRKTPLKRTGFKRKPLKARKPPSGKKKASLKTLKKKAWSLCSQAIRLEGRDCEGLVTCCSCQRRMPWKEIQAGHFIDGRFNSILFDERGIHPQCGVCNVVFNGRKEEYFLFMEHKYGRGVIDELRRQRNETRNFTVEELREMISGYKQRIEKESRRMEP